MDRQLRNEIRMELRNALGAAMAEAMETSQEKWVSSAELSAHISTLSKSWLKDYGHLLPRTQVVVTDPDGTEHRSPWSYPLHKIQRMMAQNELKKLKA